jgi:imidazole glycerol-phosphate synthase subunit HisF
MLKTRVIPCLLLKNNGLVKSVKFKNPTYVGDPINAVKIFNDKEVDELLFIDIEASRQKRGPNFDFIVKISREAFMPFGYGGGIRTLEDVKALMRLGVEKVSLNAYALENPDFITAAAEIVGSQSVVVAIDVKKDLWGAYKVYDHVSQKATKINPVEYAQMAVLKGAGEILLNSVDRDGTFSGYDIDLLKKVTSSVNIPVIALGGAGSLHDFALAVTEGNASAVAAGSFFVFYGPHRAVLITYPEKNALKKLLGEK